MSGETSQQTPGIIDPGIVYVCGHRHPDTDSIVSAIAYAHLKQKMGVNAVACRCGEVNPETKLLLQKFHQDEPLLIQDARAQMDEVEMDEPNAIPPTALLRDVIEAFEEDRKAFTVLDEKRKLLGMVTNSAIGSLLWGDTAKSIDLLRQTSIENIARAIDGKILYAPAKTSHDGRVSTAVMTNNRLQHYELENRIVIMGNDTNAQIDAIRKGAAILILVWTTQVAPMVMEEAKAHTCAVILSGHGAMNTARYLYYSTPVTQVMHKDLVVISEAEFVDDVKEKMLRTRFRNYPVVDSENRVMGLSSRYHVLNARRRKFILVDHNERKQAVANIDKADVLEIIDHHRLGDLTSDLPISFRNEPVGATATIVSKLYLENGVEPEPEMAGLLLAAIIADTLNFRSPTTSSVDRAIAAKWVELTGLDTEELAREIFQESSRQTLEDLHHLLHADMKEFDIVGNRVVISQHTMYRLNTVEAIEETLQKKLEEEVAERGADLWIMAFTSARDNGSIFYAAGKGASVIPQIFPNQEGESHSFQKGIVSRKNQVVPKLSLYLRENGLY